jgi:hypothetical protein
MLPFRTSLFQRMTSLGLHYEKEGIIFLCGGSNPCSIFLSFHGIVPGMVVRSLLGNRAAMK